MLNLRIPSPKANLMCLVKTPKLKTPAAIIAAPAPAKVADTLQKDDQTGNADKLKRKRQGAKQLSRGRTGLQIGKKKKTTTAASGVSTNL